MTAASSAEWGRPNSLSSLRRLAARGRQRPASSADRRRPGSQPFGQVTLGHPGPGPQRRQHRRSPRAARSAAAASRPGAPPHASATSAARTPYSLARRRMAHRGGTVRRSSHARMLHRETPTNRADAVTVSPRRRLRFVSVGAGMSNDAGPASRGASMSSRRSRADGTPRARRADPGAGPGSGSGRTPSCRSCAPALPDGSRAPGRSCPGGAGSGGEPCRGRQWSVGRQPVGVEEVGDLVPGDAEGLGEVMDDVRAGEAFAALPPQDRVGMHRQRGRHVRGAEPTGPAERTQVGRRGHVRDGAGAHPAYAAIASTARRQRP